MASLAFSNTSNTLPASKGDSILMPVDCTFRTTCTRQPFGFNRAAPLGMRFSTYTSPRVRFSKGPLNLRFRSTSLPIWSVSIVWYSVQL